MAPWGAALTLLGDSVEQVAVAQRELARIGIDRPAGAVTGTPEEWADGDAAHLAVLRSATFAELAAARAGSPPHGLDAPDVVLDVRLGTEWRAGHIDGAVHIPAAQVGDRLHAVPDGVVWVHCAAGYRAAAVASLLTRAGRRVVHVDDTWSEAVSAGLPIV
jgi:hydroxyacylglutathione hydrolase